MPQLFKRLRYNFQISRSNLTAVGSPHTWPSMLAAITWLVELLNYAERAEAARQVGAGSVGGWQRMHAAARPLGLLMCTHSRMSRG